MLNESVHSSLRSESLRSSIFSQRPNDANDDVDLSDEDTKLLK